MSAWTCACVRARRAPVCVRVRALWLLRVCTAAAAAAACARSRYLGYRRIRNSRRSPGDVATSCARAEIRNPPARPAAVAVSPRPRATRTRAPAAAASTSRHARDGRRTESLLVRRGCCSGGCVPARGRRPSETRARRPSLGPSRPFAARPLPPVTAHHACRNTNVKRVFTLRPSVTYTVVTIFISFYFIFLLVAPTSFYLSPHG